MGTSNMATFDAAVAALRPQIGQHIAQRAAVIRQPGALRLLGGAARNLLLPLLPDLRQGCAVPSIHPDSGIVLVCGKFVLRTRYAILVEKPQGAKWIGDREKLYDVHVSRHWKNTQSVAISRGAAGFDVCDFASELGLTVVLASIILPCGLLLRRLSPSYSMLCDYGGREVQIRYEFDLHAQYAVDDYGCKVPMTHLQKRMGYLPRMCRVHIKQS